MVLASQERRWGARPAHRCTMGSSFLNHLGSPGLLPRVSLPPPYRHPGLQSGLHFISRLWHDEPTPSLRGAQRWFPEHWPSVLRQEMS